VKSTHHHKATLVVPVQKLRERLSHRVVCVHLSPVSNTSSPAFDRLRQLGYHQIWKCSFLKKTKEFLRKKPESALAQRIFQCAGRSVSSSARKWVTPRLAEVLPLRKPRIEYALGLGQNRQKRTVRFAARSALGCNLWQRPPALAASLEYGGIQIQAEAFFWLLKQRQKPTPKRSPKRVNGA